MKFHFRYILRPINKTGYGVVRMTYTTHTVALGH